jgi:hypothetical protein
VADRQESVRTTGTCSEQQSSRLPSNHEEKAAQTAFHYALLRSRSGAHMPQEFRIQDNLGTKGRWDGAKCGFGVVDMDSQNTGRSRLETGDLRATASAAKNPDGD